MMNRLFLASILLPVSLTAQDAPPKARAVDEPAVPKAKPAAESRPAEPAAKTTEKSAEKPTDKPVAKPTLAATPPKAKPTPDSGTVTPTPAPAPPPEPVLPEPKSLPEPVITPGEFAPQPDEKEVETIVRIQIYLDEKRNGPGYIDGRIGEFGKKAASVFNQMRGIEVGNWYPLITASAAAVPEPYTTYTIHPNDLKYLTPSLPYKPQEQAKKKYLGYRSLLEFVSERFHTSEPFLIWLNKEQNLNNLDPGDIVKVPNVTPFKMEDWPKHYNFKSEPVKSARSVVVDIGARVAIFFDEQNKPFASFPITPGRPKFIKFGEWKITGMVTTPEFRWDKSMLEEGKRSDEYYQLPMGPNSPVGIIWTSTSRSGIGLHGTATPHTIGRSESAGCIRFANWDAVRLPTLIRPGARLVIR
jgi:lipoprotein-anchoring transpeptidase ErfK/SrfK